MIFKNIKPGDRVYVVPQSKDSKPYDAEIHRVGKKYGYIHRYSFEHPFDLVTGQSIHKNCNARMNGFGFDVWPSIEAYEASVAIAAANTRLVIRLDDLRRHKYSDRLDNASPELVADLHAVLDRHGV